jgi:FtsP/CotA-like multicopper oxidase with cupredoxin domain
MEIKAEQPNRDRSMSMLTRRGFLGSGIAASVIPLLASAAQSADDFRVLTLKPGEARLLGPGEPATPIWGYDGQVPGPTLRVKRGGTVKVRVVNQLPQPTSVHWHGIRIENAMDGAAGLTQAPIAPGASFDYRFTVPDAGTHWYHPHYLASEQMGRGLHGLLIVDEPEPPPVDRDVAIVVGDWRLDRSGRIHESFGNFHDASHEGRYGNTLTLNAQRNFELRVRTNERLRLRLVNVANARVMPVRIADHAAVVTAVDGQPAEPFALERARVVLLPGTRYDLFLDATRAPGSSSDILVDIGDREVAVGRLVYEPGEPKRTAPLPPPAALPANPLPERMDFANALRIEVPMEGGMMSGRMMGPGMRGPGMMMGGRVWTLAGHSSDGHSGAPLFSVKRGRTVMLNFPNDTAFPHAMHVHGHHFRHLDARDDGWKPWWLDTILVLPRRNERIAFVADNPGKWMLHCHMIEHQEAGMAAWFEVI